MADGFQSFEQRKKDHIKLALDSVTQNLTRTGYSTIRLNHQALPNTDFNSVSLKTKILNCEFNSPHFVSSMTAGHENSLTINTNLALAAKQNNWLMAVGSQRRELSDSQASSEWKNIKAAVGDIKLLSNVGILEVIQNPSEKILKLAESLGAIGLIVHLNPLQEIFQNHGNVDFTGALLAIEKLVKQSELPVVVKEVGFGVGRDTARKLFEIGVSVVDVAGAGGTHWGMIEALRQPQNSIIGSSAEAFASWGQTSVECLLSLQEIVLFEQIWASGGVRNGVDSAKCLAMGARAVGIAQPLLKAAIDSTENVSKKMQQFDFELKTAMFCTGINKCEDFLHQKVWYGTNE